MAIHRMAVRLGQKPTAEQIKRIHAAANRPVVFDDDCPELTDEQLAEMARIAPIQRAERRKQMLVTINAE